MHHEEELLPLERSSAVKRGYPTVLLRFVLVGFGVWFWQLGQQWLRSYSAPIHVVAVSLGDFGFALATPLRNYIVAAELAPLLHNLQLSFTDLTVFIIAATAIFGRTVHGALTVVLACLMRSAAQTLTPFVAVPSGILLPKLSVPTFLGNVPSHEVSFFCPHIVAVVALFLECFTHRSLSSTLGRIGAVVSAALVLFQLASALVLHVAWSVDILIAVFITVLAHRFARKLAPSLDGMKSL